MLIKNLWRLTTQQQNVCKFYIARCDDGLTFIAFNILSNQIHTKNHIKFIDFDNRVNTDKAAIFLMLKFQWKKVFCQNFHNLRSRLWEKRQSTSEKNKQQKNRNINLELNEEEKQTGMHHYIAS